MDMQQDEDFRAGNGRVWAFVVTSSCATLVFVLLTAEMMLVPGITSRSKLGMLSIAGVGLLVSLGVGGWKYETTEAPLTSWRLGPIFSVVLAIELIFCLVDTILLL